MDRGVDYLWIDHSRVEKSWLELVNQEVSLIIFSNAENTVFQLPDT
jgi:hypothetical protein